MRKKGRNHASSRMSVRVRLNAALTAVNPSPAHISTANGSPTPHTENCQR